MTDPVNNDVKEEAAFSGSADEAAPFDIQQELKKLPHRPGVYIMRDKRDAILYVGKAVDLNNRVHSYFRRIVGRGPQIERMVEQIDRFEVIVTDSELEALVLENNLIKEHRPRYNTLLKDDKTYPYIKVTAETFPRIRFTRKVNKDGARYFGPFTSAQAVRDTIDLINKLFGLRSCSREVPFAKGASAGSGPVRACLNYHMKQCTAPCIGRITREDYAERVAQAVAFLNGDIGGLLEDLEAKMQEASEKLAFEEAARFRDLRESILAVTKKQKMDDANGVDRDIIGLFAEGQDAVAQVFFVRDGRLIGREHFYLTQAESDDRAGLLGDFVKQFYAGTPFIPKELFVQEQIADSEVVEEWLSARKGERVHLVVPKRGQKNKLLQLAEENARLILTRDRERIRREEGRTIGAVREIADILGLPHLSRMEAYDISNTSGFANVGSMIVFEKGKPKRSDYRKFRIKTVAGPDDYACMREVLTRRLKHGMEEAQELSVREIDEKFGSFTRFPDLILMDGGKGQVNIALEVLDELGIDIPVAGMVKDDHHNTRGLYYNDVELPIEKDSEGFKLITRMQDEAHRFAIEYHRSLRSKAQVHSVLDEIPGIGEKRRKALMRHFDSIEEVKNADRETLMQVPEIREREADAIIRYFRGTEET
ncbi:MAG: excinuclease ABC subunit UvrC [Lachnospiraceae bacterium]|nr:excinuclease ABC subunit UvrC [Lachnospiraceae bacterium]